jgi:hypothetical protein
LGDALGDATGDALTDGTFSSAGFVSPETIDSELS